MKKFFIPISIIFFFSVCHGQTKEFAELSGSKNCRSHFLNEPISFNGDTDLVIQFLRNRFDHLNTDAVTLHVESVMESPGGIHFTFNQYFYCHRIFNSQIKVNLDNQENVRSVFDNSFDVSDWNATILDQQFERISVDEVLNSLKQSRIHDLNNIGISPVIYAEDEKNPVAVLEIKVNNIKTHTYELFIANESSNIIEAQDLNSYTSTDTPINATIFLPDPLTTAQVDYGDPYFDNNDADATELSDEMINLQTPATFSTGVFTLENSFAILQDFDPPNILPPTNTTNDFMFTRVIDGFEDVNAFYHITQFQNYIQSLGFLNLANYQIQIDAHALNGADNSMFSPATNPPRLFFGDGGVDDAEDADVVVHEYGHAISYSAAPGTLNGFERKALDEALGDYLAVSYSRSISEYNWNQVFTWDGHNEFWNGRDANTDKHYPEDISSSFHSSGEIWSGALMDIWELIGREITDKLIFQTHYSFASNLAMTDAAQLFLQSDTFLFAGIHSCEIIPVFIARGLMSSEQCNFYDPSIVLDAGDDMTICENVPSVIQTSFIAQSLTFDWLPAEYLSDPNVSDPIASPIATTTFTVTATDTNNFFDVDSITVFVQECPDEIEVANMDGFSIGNGNLIIKFPINTNSVQLDIYNSIGQNIFSLDQASNEQIEITGSLFIAGGYICRISSNSGGKTFKLLKFR